MSRSLLQTVNQSNQTVAAGGIVSLGFVVRRYGCNCQLVGDAIEVSGEGYYKLNAVGTASATAAGNVVVALYQNGVQLPGAIATGTAAAEGDYVTLPLLGTIRLGCGSSGVTNITCVLVEGASTVTNVSIRVEKG